MKSKKCVDCGQTKLLSEYRRDKVRIDGFRSECKDCSKLRNPRYYAKYRVGHLAHTKKRRDYHRQTLSDIKTNKKMLCM